MVPDESRTLHERASATTGTPVSGLGFDPSATTLFASDGNDNVARWSITPTSLEAGTAQGHSISGAPGVRSLSLAVSPHGRWLVAGPAAGTAAR